MDLLIDKLSGELDSTMKELVGRIIVRDALWGEAIELALHPDPRLAFRASWALEWAYFDSPEDLLTHIDCFVEAFLKSENGSVHRQYSKILCDMQRRQIIVFDDIRLSQISEKAFDLLVSPDVRTAVKVWCIELLFDASLRLDWIRDALNDILQHIMESNPSRGLANRASKVLRRLG